MKCDHALERLLEADPSELSAALGAARTPGPGADPGDALAAHLAACDRCASVAWTLTHELSSLHHDLAAFGDAADADFAANAALTASRRMRVERPAGSAIASASRRRVWWKRLTWVPVAAATAVTALLLLRTPDLSGPPATGESRAAGTGAVPQVQLAAEARFAVTAPPDRSTAIMKTANPRITIVWLY